MTLNSNTQPRRTVLIVGATGVIGDAALSFFCKLGDCSVIALSRRKPQCQDVANFSHINVDLTDTLACQNEALGLGKVTHVIYAAVAEKSNLVEGWHDQEQISLNGQMLKNLIEPLCETAPKLEHISLLQGAKAYGAHAGFPPQLSAKESAPRVEHDNFYWLQEDYIREKAAAVGFNWTIFRPQVIIGAAWGAAMNPLLPLCAYAAIRREEGKALNYPGGVTQVGELVDASLLAQAFHWASLSDSAINQTFNITNGDIFAWREAWPTIAHSLAMSEGNAEPTCLAEYLLERSDIWDSIVTREQLQPLSLAEFLGKSHHYADILLRANATQTAHPMLLSTIKLRLAGFNACRDSLQSVQHWIGELKRRRLIPQ